MKVYFIIIFIFLFSCTHTVERNFGLHETIPSRYEILSIDTIYNEYGGVVKKVLTKERK